jgi:hypothetical protein
MKNNLLVLYVDTLHSIRPTKKRAIPVFFFMLITSCLLIPNSSQAQSLTLKDGVYSIGYLNESIFRSGAIVGGEWAYKKWEKNKQNRKGATIKKERTLIINPQIGVYSHIDNHKGLITKVDFTIKRNKQSSTWSHHWSAGLGIITQYNSGITYILNNDNSIDEQKNASRSYFNPSVSYALEKQIDSMFSVFTKLGLGIKTPYNTWLAPSSIFEIGTKINIRNHE